MRITTLAALAGALLTAAHVPFEALSPGVDEDAAKDALRADGLDARALAAAAVNALAIEEDMA